MKKILLIILLCFAVIFAMSAIDMSPHPGDSIESVFIVQDVVVQNDVLYLKSITIYNETEICVSAEANDEQAINPNYFMDYLSAVDAVAVSDIGYEMGNDNLYNTGEDVAIYCMEYG